MAKGVLENETRHRKFTEVLVFLSDSAVFEAWIHVSAWACWVWVLSQCSVFRLVLLRLSVYFQLFVNVVHVLIYVIWLQRPQGGERGRDHSIILSWRSEKFLNTQINLPLIQPWDLKYRYFSLFSSLLNVKCLPWKIETSLNCIANKSTLFS